MSINGNLPSTNRLPWKLGEHGPFSYHALTVNIMFSIVGLAEVSHNTKYNQLMSSIMDNTDCQFIFVSVIKQLMDGNQPRNGDMFPT